MEYIFPIIILSYLIGSFPTSLVYSRYFKGIDIRKFGSGNAGGTNVFRVLGWKPGVVVILIDALKGYATVAILTSWYFRSLLPESAAFILGDFIIIQLIAGVVAVIGHVWTVFAGFKGGKGIATAAGVVAAIAPVEFAVSVTVFAVILLSFRYVSLASMSAAVAFPIAMLVRQNLFSVEIPHYSVLLGMSIAFSGMLIFTHRKNIQRLLKGNEAKI